MYISSLDQFAQGSGLLQVERAFDLLVTYCDAPERDVRFAINCGVNNSKGIHIRTGVIDRPKDCAITVEPVFLDTENIGLYFYKYSIDHFNSYINMYVCRTIT